MLHKLKGAGLPNVYLYGGVAVEGTGEDQTIAYAKLDGLYREIARAIALRLGPMSGSELRFLRKRLGMTQADVAALGGKTEQVVAKWEKEILPVPKAEASLLRLSVLSRFGTKEEMSLVVSQLLNVSSKREQYPYVIKFDGTAWSLDDSLAIQMSSQRSTSQRAVIDFGTGEFGNASADTVGLAGSEASGQLLFSQLDETAASVATLSGSLVSFSGVGTPRRFGDLKYRPRLSRVGTGAQSPFVFTTFP